MNDQLIEQNIHEHKYKANKISREQIRSDPEVLGPRAECFLTGNRLYADRQAKLAQEVRLACVVNGYEVFKHSLWNPDVEEDIQT